MIHHFQTPPSVCDHMVSLVVGSGLKILEPSPGAGNLASAIEKKGHRVFSPDGDFWKMRHDIRYDCIVMNPPFTPMQEGYAFLYEAMNLSDNIIALLPWLVLINSERRIRDIMAFGLKSVTTLPRSVFKGSRVQCCILQMQKGYTGTTLFNHYIQN